MVKWIFIGIIAMVVVIVIAASIGDDSTKPSGGWSGATQRSQQATKNYVPATHSNRQTVAINAARSMENHKMQNNGTDAVQIQRAVNQQRVNINTSFLSTAQIKINNICGHAETIRQQIQQHYNDSSYLIKLYRVGVGVSNEAYTLRNEVKGMKDSLYRMSRSNTSLKPLFNKVNAFYQSVYENEVELNNRNRTLRMYIGNNFGSSERRWNEDIERRARAKKAV